MIEFCEIIFFEMGRVISYCLKTKLIIKEKNLGFYVIISLIGFFEVGRVFSYIRRVPEIILPASMIGIYTLVVVAAACWELIDLGQCAPSNHHQRIWNYIYHRSR